jgi:hypothetical protein
MLRRLESELSKNNIECLGDIEFLRDVAPNMLKLIRNIVESDRINNVSGMNVLNEMSLPGCLDTYTVVESDKVYRVFLQCNWTTSENLCNIWEKMSCGGGKWNNIQIVSSEPADYYCVINATQNMVEVPHPERTIVFRMEPNMEENSSWGIWSKPDPSKYMFVGYHSTHYNNNEWHISKSYTDMMKTSIEKDTSLDGVLSTVLSDKYQDEGHIKRIDFCKYMESKGSLGVHVFGGNRFNWKEYKGSPPYHQKDEAMIPYKYVFNCENQFVKGYYTEKLVDAILSECLVFYHGCPDIKTYIDERAFVWLELADFETDMKKIQDAISSNLWENRLPFIREAKHKILTERQFFPRIHSIINTHISNSK